MREGGSGRLSALTKVPAKPAPSSFGPIDIRAGSEMIAASSEGGRQRNRSRKSCGWFVEVRCGQAGVDGSDVRDVMVNGRLVVRDAQPLTLDAKHVLA